MRTSSRLKRFLHMDRHSDACANDRTHLWSMRNSVLVQCEDVEPVTPWIAWGVVRLQPG